MFTNRLNAVNVEKERLLAEEKTNSFQMEIPINTIDDQSMR